MKKILITGGLGFLGQHLINFLSQEDVKIKCIDLKENSHPIFQFKNVECKTNRDITDFNSIEKEFKDIDIVFHLAGLVSFWRRDKDKLYKINVDGTQNVLKACSKHKVKQVIHISSVAALGYNNDKKKPVNESFSFNWKNGKNKDYMMSKHLADIEVKKYAQNGLNCAIAHPGLLYGPGDLNNTLKIISAISTQKLPFNMPGGTNIIDVRDVARGLICLMKKGKSGNHYILGGHNISFVQHNKMIASVVGVTPPKKNMPLFMHQPLKLVTSLVESIYKKPIPVTTDNIDSSFMFRYFDSSKAMSELGWKPEVDFVKTIKDSWVWLKKERLI